MRFARRGGPALRVETAGFPHFALWSKPNAPFLSIEAWTGHGDPQDFSGELFDKPSVNILEPGEVGRHIIRYMLELRDGSAGSGSGL